VVEYSGILPIWIDMGSQSAGKPERRTAIMARVEVSWEDQTGTTHHMIGKLEDTSRNGACIRCTEPITVGSKLKIKWHLEQFSGVSKYCRRDEEDYVLGIQRDPVERKVEAIALPESAPGNIQPTSAVKAQEAPAQQEVKRLELPIVSIKEESAPSDVSPTLPAKIQDVPAEQEGKRQDLSTTGVKPGMASEAGKTNDPATRQSGVVHCGTALEGGSGVSHPQESDGLRRAEFKAQESLQSQERTHMLTKLLHMGSGRHQEDAPPGGNTSGTNGSGSGSKSSPAPANKANAISSVKSYSRSQGDLLPLEDIYHAAGITNTRLGYNITTVMTMIDSNHLRGLSGDVKRASVLMALEAAGIPIDEVLRDATQRQDALSVYEAGQRKQLEEYEARKTQENSQIQTEIERITAHYLDRMKHNLDEVTQVKERLRSWQTMKQEEAQRISEAVGLCVKRPPAEAPSDSLLALQPAGAAVKP